MGTSTFSRLFLSFGSNYFLNQDLSSMAETINILGTPLQLCCKNPMTGFFRDGYCKTGADDLGRHVVCARMTAEFLEFTKSRGNDLSTPLPAYNFRAETRGQVVLVRLALERGLPCRCCASGYSRGDPCAGLGFYSFGGTTGFCAEPAELK